ncbi:MAG: Pyridine nucleotide-disulfide oxidoreductase [Chlamydiia bacterium]|nr:Pyridine nucleotide-disulfide oxidoreductase [Chlamydiia bacterium]
MGYPKVIIIGGGFAGLNAAKALNKAEVDLLLLDKSNHHLFQPLLYQVATAALSADNIASPLRKILKNQKNTSVFLADIASIDKHKKEVIAANGDRFSYNFLIVAPGARHSYFGNNQWEALAPGLKTVSDALNIRERILLSYERAERAENCEKAARFLRFIIIGGGPTGVEMAGAIAEIATQSLTKNFRHIQPEQTKIYLIEGESHVLPTFPKKLSIRAQQDLEKLGVEVLVKTLVTQVTPDGVWLGDKFIESPNIIWAAGTQASPLIGSLDTPLDRCGRAIVNPDLSIPGHPEIFVIGDAAHCIDKKKKKPLPGVASVAIQQGRYVARIIAHNTPPEKRKAFAYFDKGIMATVGKAKAVAAVGKLKISGYLAWLAWCFVHIFYLVSFTNRLLVLFHWLYLYIFNKRRIRLIIRPVSDFDDPLYTEEQKIPKSERYTDSY